MYGVVAVEVPIGAVFNPLHLIFSSQLCKLQLATEETPSQYCLVDYGFNQCPTDPQPTSLRGNVHFAALHRHLPLGAWQFGFDFDFDRPANGHFCLPSLRIENVVAVDGSESGQVLMTTTKI